MSQVKGSVPYDCPFHFRSQLQVVGLQVTHNFCPSWLQIGGSQGLPTLGFHYLSSSSQNSRKHLLIFTSVLKDMTKDMDEQPHEEIHRRRSGKVASTGASVSGVGVCRPPGTRMCSTTWKLLEACVIGTFMEALSHRRDWSLTPFLALSPLWRTRVGCSRKFWACNHGLVFPVTSPHPGACPESPH